MLKLKHKGLKIILLIVLIIVIISGIALIIVNNNINSIVEDKVYSNFNESEYSEYYDLSFNNLHINVLNGTIKFSDVRLIPKTNVDTTFFYKNGKYNIEIKDYILKGANIYRFINTDTLNVKLVRIVEPKFESIRYIKDTIQENDGKIIMSPFVEIKQMEIINANFLSSNFVNNTSNSLSNASLIISNFKYNSDSVSRNLSFEKAEITTSNFNRTDLHEKLLNIDNSKALILDFDITMFNDTLVYSYNNFNIEVDGISTHTKNRYYNISLEKLDLNIANHNISISNIHLKPNYSRAEFSKINKYQNELFDIKLNKIDIININLDSLVYRNAVLIDSIIFDGGTADIYKDKTLPLDSNKFPLLPNLQILKIPFKLDVKKVFANNVDVIYTEKTELGRLGKVDLNVNAEITNVSTVNATKPLLLEAKGKIHNTAKFNLNVSFDYKINGFYYEGNVGSFNVTNLNEVISSFMPLKVKKGVVHKIQFSGYAGKSVSNGKMIFAYNNLKLKVLDEEGQKNVNKYTRNVLSLTANTIIQTNNPVSKKEKLEAIEFTFQKDKNRGFFNYLWKSVLSGLSATVIPNKIYVEKYKGDFLKWHKNLWHKKEKKKKR